MHLHVGKVSMWSSPDSMLNRSWLTGGREYRREGVYLKSCSVRSLWPLNLDWSLMVFEKRLKCITWNPLFQVGTQVTVLLKTRQIPVLKKISHLYDLEVVKILCSRGKTFTQFLLCADVFVLVKSWTQKHLSSQQQWRGSHSLIHMRLPCLLWKAVCRSRKWPPAGKLELIAF